MPRQETPFENFRLLDVTRPQDLEALEDLLLPSLDGGPAAWAVLDLLVRLGQCRTVIVEESYVDRAHRRAYASFYIHGFRHIDRTSTRLHFFSEPFSRRQLTTLESNPRIRESYLGYCVLRPLTVRKVGRAVLAPPPADADKRFVLAQSAFPANVGACQLTAEGSAYIEQDRRVAACASCAIWMSSANMSDYMETPTPTPAEITSLATRNLVGDRALPSESLTPEQMMQALHAIGYQPALTAVLDRQHAMSVLYPHIESRIAPILLVQLLEGFHAITAVGHTYCPDGPLSQQTQIPWARGESISFWRSSCWVDSILVHDDQRGPYRTLRFVDPTDVPPLVDGLKQYMPDSVVPSPELSEWRCPVVIDMTLPLWEARGGSGWPPYGVGNLYGVILPLPPRVSLLGSEAERKAARLLRLWYGMMLDQPVPDDTVLRTYLTTSKDFKRAVATAKGPSRFVKRMYSGKPLPRWIWVTEVGKRSEMITAQKGARRIRGEIVLDGNGSPWTLGFVAVHLALGNGIGYMGTTRPEDKDPQDALLRGRVFTGDFPYEGLVR